MAVVLTLGLTFGSADADAKRLGGGRSTGTQRQMTTSTPASAPAQAPTASPSATTKAPASAPTPAAAQPKRSWMGPLAGLAAGLGLAALASHFGFGEELASMMMIGLAVMAVLLVVGMVMRKRAATQQPALAGLGGATHKDMDTSGQRGYDVSMPDNRGTSLIGSAIETGSGGGTAADPARIPADFDVAGFVRNAKVQFIRLQASHDAGNLDDIRDFTTPEMFAEIKMDVTDRGAAPQRTDVVSLNADVLEVVEDAQQYLVSVRFTGVIRETADATPQAFDEVWHLVKPRTGGHGWVLSGIQQMA